MITRQTLADINAEDIERIELVKGAAASSLYGSDAANGVVQIFTRRGSSLAEGQTNFTFRNEYGQNYLPNVLNGNMHNNYNVVCGPDHHACTESEANTSAVSGFDTTGVGLGNRSTTADGIADNPYPVYYDQLRVIFKTGQFYTNYASVGQRRGSTNFNASFQNQHDAGVVNELHGYQRENFRLNVDQALTEKIDLGAGAFYGRSYADQPDDYAFLFGLRFIEPNVKLDSVVTSCPASFPACTYVGQYNPVIKQPPLSGNLNNPLYEFQARHINNARDRFAGTFKGTYRPLTWLTGDANIGYDQASRNYTSYTSNGYTFSGSAQPSAGGLFEQADADHAYNTQLGLTSIRSFWNDQIRNTSKVAYLYEDQTDQFVNVNALQLLTPNTPEFASSNINAGILPGSSTQITRAKNVFFITTFDIKDRYVLDGLVRQDQSSLFGSNERTAVYHRLSAAWRVTEDFAIPGVDELKLRASHGTAGLRPS